MKENYSIEQLVFAGALIQKHFAIKVEGHFRKVMANLAVGGAESLSVIQDRLYQEAVAELRGRSFPGFLYGIPQEIFETFKALLDSGVLFF